MAGNAEKEGFTNNAPHVAGNAEKEGLQTMHGMWQAMLSPGQYLSSRGTIREQYDGGLCITYHRIKKRHTRNHRAVNHFHLVSTVWNRNTTLDYHSCVLHPGVTGAP